MKELAALSLTAVLMMGRPGAITEPTVALRYPGGADGAPVLNELAAIKAVGFDAVGWAAPTHLPELRRLAAIVDLAVIVLPSPSPLTDKQARTPGDRIDVRVGDAETRGLTPLVWRAVAHGARSIAFDRGHGAGTGLTRADGSAAPWVAPAVAIARHLSANRRLVDVMKPGPALTVDVPAGADVDVVLLDGGRAWVIVATSLTAAPVTARVTFPKGVPSGLWASWIDDSEMSMLYRPTGPVWTAELEAFGTKVYFIDKNLTRGTPGRPGTPGTPGTVRRVRRVRSGTAGYLTAKKESGSVLAQTPFRTARTDPDSFTALRSRRTPR